MGRFQNCQEGMDNDKKHNGDNAHHIELRQLGEGDALILCWQQKKLRLEVGRGSVFSQVLPEWAEEPTPGVWLFNQDSPRVQTQSLLYSCKTKVPTPPPPGSWSVGQPQKTQERPWKVFNPWGLFLDAEVSISPKHGRLTWPGPLQDPPAARKD